MYLSGPRVTQRLICAQAAQLDFTLLSLQLACPGLPASQPHCKASGGPCLALDCDTGVRAEE